jgi:Fic-DOC domain mobile mystery protein B
MGLELEYTEGQTPIDEDEKTGLLIPEITTRAELDEFEQWNIEQAVQWSLTKTFKPEAILSEAFIRELHKRMFGRVWAWAGEFRKTDKNIGVEKWQISTELKKLVDDTLYWIANKSYGPDEIAIRFKHQLVSIHCFSNGNGRHSRLIADIIANKIFNRPVFSWGANSIKDPKELRKSYIQALRAADKGDYSALVEFGRM